MYIQWCNCVVFSDLIEFISISAKISHRLTMFYLANDVVQNSKRKGFLLFVNSFAEVLKEATLLVRSVVYNSCKCYNTLKYGLPSEYFT